MKIILFIGLLLSNSFVYSMDCSEIKSPVTQAFCEANNRRAEETNERGQQEEQIDEGWQQEEQIDEGEE